MQNMVANAISGRRSAPEALSACGPRRGRRVLPAVVGGLRRDHAIGRQRLIGRPSVKSDAGSNVRVSVAPFAGEADSTVAFVHERTQAEGTDRRFKRTPGAVKAVRLLDADRDLARRVGTNAGEARAAAVAGAVALPRGRWNPAIAAKRIRGGFGLLVLRGLLMRDLEGSEALGAELLAEGDLLGPDDGSEERLLGLQPQWEILEPARLLVLDAAFAQRIAAFPGLGAALVDRAHERARRTAIALALSHLPRVEDRLHRLLWHLADRRGRGSSARIVLFFPLTPEQPRPPRRAAGPPPSP